PRGRAMACSAAAGWTLPAALAITLASALPASTETTAAAMTAFGLTGTWSDDCTKDPAKEGARLIYSPPGTRTPSYRFVMFDKDGNKITVSSDILTAERRSACRRNSARTLSLKSAEYAPLFRPTVIAAPGSGGRRPAHRRRPVIAAVAGAEGRDRRCLSRPPCRRLLGSEAEPGAAI